MDDAGSERNRFEYNGERQRSDIIRAFLRHLDTRDTDRPVGHHEEAIRETDEANDSNPDTSGEQVDDQRDVDSGSGDGTASNSGQSDARTIGDRGDVDERTASGSDIAQEHTSDASERPVATERTEQASDGDQRQLPKPASVFAAFQNVPRIVDD